MKAQKKLNLLSYHLFATLALRYDSKSCVMTDRRRINGPPGGTRPPVFASLLKSATGAATERPVRTRQPNELRKICKNPEIFF